jgi:arylsulfatase A-like enzyme
VDRFIKELWETVQSLREYRDQTTFIIATDHGRGPAPVAWKSHGQAIKDSAFIWVAILGPDTPPLGERQNVPLVTQSQIAATVAAAVGEDYRAAFPQAAPPIGTK